MSMIFPGMDPYLEKPSVWFEVHQRLIVYLADLLQPLIRPRYRAAIEARVYVEGPNREILPDVTVKRRTKRDGQSTAVAMMEPDTPVMVAVSGLEIRESYLNILDRDSGLQIVTVIEVVSPTNKYAGPGHNLYLRKQKEVLRSTAHLVEIDLLRSGPHVLAVPEAVVRAEGEYDYLVSVNRADALRENFELYLRTIRERLPRIGIPLAEGDPDVALDLQTAVEQVYELGDYRETLNYKAACKPPLRSGDRKWAEQLVRKALKNGARRA